MVQPLIPEDAKRPELYPHVIGWLTIRTKQIQKIRCFHCPVSFSGGFLRLKHQFLRSVGLYNSENRQRSHSQVAVGGFTLRVIGPKMLGAGVVLYFHRIWQMTFCVVEDKHAGHQSFGNRISPDGPIINLHRLIFLLVSPSLNLSSSPGCGLLLHLPSSYS